MTSTFSIGDRETEPITLSALEFDVVWEHLRLGTLPLVVKVPSPGRTDEERARLEARAWADLEARGLGRHRKRGGEVGGVHPDLEELLGLLARPEREVDARVYVGRNARVLAAAIGDAAVAAELSDGSLTLRRVSAAGLPSAALEVLPPAPVGPGQSVTLRTEDFEAAASDAAGTSEGFYKALLGKGIRADDANALVEMIKDVAHTGNFGAAARDRLGRRRRAERVVSFFDTEDGRYVQVRRPAPDGTLWSTISPADVRKLTHHVTEVLTEIVDEVAGAR